MKNRMMPEQRRYPTDSLGFPIPVRDLSEPLYIPDSGEAENNHHLNFYARSFGLLAISQTFRDLDSMQETMVIWRHDLLHRLYGGIEVPPLKNMLERIEQEQAEGGKLKIHLSHMGYVYHDITEVALKTLKAEYSQESRYE